MRAHLGGGMAGIEYLMRHIGVSKASWLETMAKWTATLESAIEGWMRWWATGTWRRWSDRYLIALYKLLWTKK
jgi:hypothetical protein